VVEGVVYLARHRRRAAHFRPAGRQEECAMELQVKSRNGKVSPRQQAFILEKLGKLERYEDQLQKATVEVSEEQRRDQGTVTRVQVTLEGAHGLIVRADQTAPDLHAAIDAVEETLERQIKRYKDKHWRRGRPRRHDSDTLPAAPELNGAMAEEAAPRIVRTKEFYVKPMFSDEAVEQMELLGHDFFVFRDANTSQINVLYRRKDGNYGLIVPAVGE
jgi:ribosomal subunit interface protein